MRLLSKLDYIICPYGITSSKGFISTINTGGRMDFLPNSPFCNHNIRRLRNTIRRQIYPATRGAGGSYGAHNIVGFLFYRQAAPMALSLVVVTRVVRGAYEAHNIVGFLFYRQAAPMELFHFFDD